MSHLVTHTSFVWAYSMYMYIHVCISEIHVMQDLSQQMFKGGGYMCFNDEVLRLQGFFKSPWPFANNSEAF